MANDSGIKRIDRGKWQIRARVRVDGKIIQRQETITGEKADARRKLTALKREIREGKKTSACSLNIGKHNFSTFGGLIDFYISRKGPSTMQSTMSALKRDLGNVRVYDLPERFDSYIQILRVDISPKTGKPRTESTINRYIAVGKMICGYACKGPNQFITGLRENPLSGFSLTREDGRDRVLSEYEGQRLLGTLSRLNSYLYWPVVFSLKNPIRRGDLSALTWENLDMTKPWIHFYASKTKKRRNRETCLIFLDEDILQYWRNLQREYPENPYLFPRIDGTGFHPLGDFKKHWHKVLEEAGIQDFKFHDLKHCSITWMLDNGYTERDLKNLGIQYTTSMIDRYYQHDAQKVLKKWKTGGECENIVKTSFSEAV